MTRVSRSLHRSLLKIAKQFDNSPASKALIYRKSLSNLDKGAPSIHYTELLDKLFKKDSYLYQPWGDVTSLRELIRSHSRQIDKKTSESDRLDVGFAVLRKLSSLWNSFITLENIEYDEYDNDEGDNEGHLKQFSQVTDSLLLTNGVTLSENLSSGVILVAHPMLQGPLHRCVILLLEHNSKGSYGVVINRGTDRSVESSVKNLPANLVETFGQNNIAFGGMIRRLTYLHDVQEVGGVQIPTCKSPMYAGGPTHKAISFVKESNVSVDTDMENSNSQISSDDQQCDPAERFRFFVGCCLWEADELEKEVNSGYWIPVHSEPDTLLKLAMPTSAEIINLASLENDLSESIDPKNIEIEEIVKTEGIVEGNLDEEIRKPTISEIMESVASSDDDDDEEEEFEEYGQEENYGIDTWKVLLRSLGEPFSSLAELPKRFSARNIESADWK